MQLPIELDRNSRGSLALQLCGQLRDAIREGRIPAGARLPSSRALADQLGLSRNTVLRVYETLVAEGHAESRAGSGIFATHTTAAALRQSSRLVTMEPDGMRLGSTLPTPTPARTPRELATGRHGVSFDFVPGRPSVELFPIKTWRRLLQACLSYRGAAGLAERGDAAGLQTLRAAIAAHLAMSRGVLVDPAQIIVVSGVQEGLSLAASVLLQESSLALIEDPGYQGAALVFAAAGARVAGVPVDEDGLMPSALPTSGAALLYVTPAHQYPTGHVLSLARRRELVAWSRSSGCYLIEDDYDSEFQYDSPPAQALAGLAPDCTVHLGTFSTTLGPGLRLGYLVAPPQLLDALRAAKCLLGQSSSWLDQAALAELIRSGSYAQHLERCSARYREARDTLLVALRRNFGRVEISGQAAGLHLLWQLPAGVPGAARLEELARRHRVGVYSLDSAAAVEQEPSSLTRRSLLLGFAAMPLKQIEPGIARLSDALDDALDDHHELLGELMLDAPRAQLVRPALRRGRSAIAPRYAPALRTVAGRGQRFRTGEEPTHMRSVRGIYRYPIKGLSPQPLPGITLEEGKPFPFDRVFALVRPGVSIDASEPRWAKKGLFLMLMLEDSLARVRTQLDVETMQLDVYEPHAGGNAVGGRQRPLLSVNLDSSEGRAAAEAFFYRQVPKLKAQPQLVRSRSSHFMDKPDSVVSCINLATLRSLEARWGIQLHPLRFRANFYIEGARPWEEFDWVGSDIRLGDVLFRVDRRNGRCSATNVNPVSGERDLDIPGSLRQAFGHKDLGIYLIARSSGKIVLGDPVSVPDIEPSSLEPASVPATAAGPDCFICRGCYYILDTTRGAPGIAPGTAFDAIGADFRCPDCGTDKAKFRRHLPDAALAEGA